MFGTPQGADVAADARGYGVGLVEVASEAGFLDALSVVGSPGTHVIVVRTDRQANVGVHDRLNAAVAQAVEATLPR